MKGETSKQIAPAFRENAMSLPHGLCACQNMSPPKPRVTILPGRYATAGQAAACAPGSWPDARTAQLHHCGEGRALL